MAERKKAKDQANADKDRPNKALAAERAEKAEQDKDARGAQESLYPED